MKSGPADFIERGVDVLGGLILFVAAVVTILQVLFRYRLQLLFRKEAGA